MARVTVRYIVDDVDAAIAFYTQRLGFVVELRPAPGFASVSRGDLSSVDTQTRPVVDTPNPASEVGVPRH